MDAAPGPMAETGRADGARRRRLARLTGAIGVLVGVAVPSYLVLDRSQAAFTAQTSTAVNTFSAGTITLTDDDSATAMFAMSGMSPGSTSTRCITVSYGSTVSASSNVELSASQTVAPLSPYLDVVIREGSVTGGTTFPACTGFAATSTLFTGTLATLVADHGTYATGLGSWAPTTSATRTYEVTVTLADVSAAQGLSANVTLQWEARTS